MNLSEFSCTKGPVARLGADVETQETKGLFPVGVSVAALTQANTWPPAPHLLWTAQNSCTGKEHSPASLHWHCLTRLSATGCGIPWDAAGAGTSSGLWCPNSHCEPQGSSTVGQESFPTLRGYIPSLLCSPSVFLFQLEPVVILPSIPR